MKISKSIQQLDLLVIKKIVESPFVEFFSPERHSEDKLSEPVVC